jgi:UDP-N-acetylmuramate dehydrogenase
LNRLPNSLGVTASADRVVLLGDRDQLSEVRHQTAASPTLMLGDGSNVLFVDDFHGTAVLNRLTGISLLEQDECSCLIEAAAGESWDALVRWACDRGYWGLENLALIPGRVGAAPIQNIGAYGVELRDSCVAVEVLTEDGSLRWLDAHECDFGYRDSVFKHRGAALWITALRLRLSRVAAPNLSYTGLAEALTGQKRDALTPTQVAEAVRQIRRSKLPDPALLGNAGSFFKNPTLPLAQVQALRSRYPQLPSWPLSESEAKTSAAWLIEQAGWKGHRTGDAGVASGHALVLVNHGHASGTQLWALAQAIANDVWTRFGVQLEVEPRVIGKQQFGDGSSE